MAEAHPESATNADGLGATVAQHYNELKETGLAARTQSRIFYMRNFNNWIKSMAISEFLGKIRKRRGSDPISVLDLCCGKGGDLLKWKKGNISKLTCADIAAVSVEQCESRYKELCERSKRERFSGPVFSAEFMAADCTKERLKDKFKDQATQFDLVSCQFSFHYGFESYEQADMMLRNACECLRPGGYFLGTTPDANELVKRLRNSPDNSFGNDVYRVTFETDDKNSLPLFGARYKFHLEGVVDCPEFLVYFPLLEKMAERYGMELVYKMPFADFFKLQLNMGEGRGLIGRMQGLEPYPAEEDVELLSGNKDSYKAAEALLTKLKNDNQETRPDDGRTQKPKKVGTLSQEEWEATSIYVVFAMKKIADITPPFVPPASLSTDSPSPSEPIPTCPSGGNSTSEPSPTAAGSEPASTTFTSEPVLPSASSETVSTESPSASVSTDSMSLQHTELASNALKRTIDNEEDSDEPDDKHAKTL